MELYLLKDETVKFVGIEPIDDFVITKSDPFSVTLEPVDSECENSKEYCKFIGNQATVGFSDQFELGHKWRAELTIPEDTYDHGKLDLFHESHPKGGTVLYDVLVRLFTQENLSFQLMIKDLDINYSCRCKTKVDLESLDCSVHFKNLNFPRHELHPEATIKGGLTNKCLITLTVKLSYSALAKVPFHLLCRGIPGAKCKALLNEAVGSDFEIVAANGAVVKCHKCILMVSSDVFRAMFESNMQERIINRLEMPDMSEARVRAFLNFIYTSDLEAATKKCDIALELFQAGDKYGMAVLKNRMKIVICSKPSKWFKIDMVVRLSRLVQNLEQNEDIWKKMAKVVKWYSKKSAADLLASEEYQALFRKNPEAAMELFSTFMRFA